MENFITKREEAYSIHQRILTNGKIVQSALIDMCRDLKQMRDDGLYKELGYDNFEDYSEQACGIKKRQAHSYIAVYEKLGKNFISEHSEMGITRLELISQISSYEREEFLEENDVAELSTRELKKQVNEFKSRTEQLSLELDSARNDNEALAQQVEDLKSNLENSNDAEIVATVLPDKKIIQQAVNEAVAEEKSQNDKKIQDLENQLKMANEEKKILADNQSKEIAKAKKEALDKANKKIEKLVAENKATDEKLQQALKSAKAANADEDVTAVRFLFNDLQATASEIKKHLEKINNKNPEQSDKLSALIKDILEKMSRNF